MSYKYFPHTDDDLQQMMQRVGISSLDDLYAEVPEAIRFRGDYDLPDEMSETEVRQVFEQLGAMNRPMMCFGGAGVYDHYTPAVIPNLLSRSELLTSYTPYQAEISQGTLHYIFEYQSMMAELTGMDISNASMYDGTTACAEAMMMAAASGKKQNRFLVSDTVNPKTLQVMQTYAHYHGIQLGTVASRDGVTDREDLERQLAEGGVAGVLVQQPNYFGIVEDYSGFADLIHTNKGLFVIDSIAADLALLKTPGEWGADIAVGDAQSLGIPMQFGGPYVGYLCCTEKLLRKMPRDAPTANRANTAPSLPPCFRPKAASSAYMGPPTHWPCRSRRRYRTARKLSAKMVAMPNRADSSIHTNAPGPPAARAVATPTMFPVPMLAARAVIRAEKGDTPSRHLALRHH